MKVLTFSSPLMRKALALTKGKDHSGSFSHFEALTKVGTTTCQGRPLEHGGLGNGQQIHSATKDPYLA